jgi:hypothetical protein
MHYASSCDHDYLCPTCGQTVGQLKVDLYLFSLSMKVLHKLLLFLRLHSWQLNHQQPGEIIPADLGIILLGAHEIGL